MQQVWYKTLFHLVLLRFVYQNAVVVVVLPQKQASVYARTSESQEKAALLGLTPSFTGTQQQEQCTARHTHSAAAYDTASVQPKPTSQVSES